MTKAPQTNLDQVLKLVKPQSQSLFGPGHRRPGIRGERTWLRLALQCGGIGLPR